MTAAVDSGWSHAVPLDETTGFSQPRRTDTLKSQESNISGGHRELRSTTSRRPSDFGVPSDSEIGGPRKASGRTSNVTASRKRSRTQLQDKPVEGRVDDSPWIHRDKLAQIEIQEMAQARIRVRQPRKRSSAGQEGSMGRTSRSASRSGAQRSPTKERPTSDEQYGDEQHGPLYDSFDDYRPRIPMVPSVGDGEEREPVLADTVDTQPRTPEEVVAEQLMSKQNLVRPSTSRIPVSKASPLPVPQTVVDRDSPLPRSRNGSGAWSGAFDEIHYARRARSISIGSQPVFEVGEGVNTPPRPRSSYIRTSIENSPPKARMPTKATPTSGARQGSGLASGQKARTPSTTRKRPISSSGHKSRPSTGHAAPEGEAPWIASMYKPDPRLPPDQQLLPTHAKRLMQEQWEKEGRTSTAFDRDLNPLNANGDDFEQQQLEKAEARAALAAPALQPDPNLQWTIEPLPKPTPHIETPADSPATIAKPWPLTPSRSSLRSESASLRPGTSGGYKVIPTITPPAPIVRTPRVAPPIAPHNPTARLPADFGNDDEKYGPMEGRKKGGGCCMVM